MKTLHFTLHSFNYFTLNLKEFPKTVLLANLNVTLRCPRELNQAEAVTDWPGEAAFHNLFVARPGPQQLTACKYSEQSPKICWASTDGTQCWADWEQFIVTV